MYQRKIVLADADFDKLLHWASQPHYLQNIGQVVAPFMYLLALGFCLPTHQRKRLCRFAETFDTPSVRDLIEDARKGKDGKRVNLF